MGAQKAHIVVVEDEEAIGQGLCDVLIFRGHEVTWKKDGASALVAAAQPGVDLVLLDVMLPEKNGYEVCEALRAQGVRAGILMLTAKGAEEDILRGFDAGADDYVTKPFSLKQLLARVEAVLGRSRRDSSDKLSAYGMILDIGQSVVTGPKGQTDVTAREIQILRLLFEEQNRIVSRRTLLREAWEMHNVDGVETRTVDVHMGKLRKKLSDIADCSIVAVRGQGYRLTAGVDP